MAHRYDRRTAAKDYRNINFIPAELRKSFLEGVRAGSRLTLEQAQDRTARAQKDVTIYAQKGDLWNVAASLHDWAYALGCERGLQSAAEGKSST